MGSKAKEEELVQEETTTKKKDKKEIDIKKILKITWKIIEKIMVVAIIFISIIILTQRLSNNEKSFFGYRMFRVETQSMTGVYDVGNVILVREIDTNKLEVDDDVTYYGTKGSMKGLIVTHRIIGIEEVDGQRIFHTKGVANNLEDPEITGDQIIGVVQSKLYILSTICTLLSNRYVFYFGAILPLTIFIFFSFIKGNLNRFEEYK